MNVDDIRRCSVSSRIIRSSAETVMTAGSRAMTGAHIG